MTKEVSPPSVIAKSVSPEAIPRSLTCFRPNGAKSSNPSTDLMRA